MLSLPRESVSSVRAAQVHHRYVRRDNPPLELRAGGTVRGGAILPAAQCRAVPSSAEQRRAAPSSGEAAKRSCRCGPLNGQRADPWAGRTSQARRALGGKVRTRFGHCAITH